jgi:hypothetical protein
MLSPAQEQKLSYLSDTVFYPEAVGFLHRLVQQEGCNPLQNSQVTGLRNVARSVIYSELLRYIQHQKNRDWQTNKQDLKVFYSELEIYLTTLRNKRLRTEFHLVSDGLTNREMITQIDELMGHVAAEFLQHLLAENGLLQQKQKQQKKPYQQQQQRIPHQQQQQQQYMRGR